jgi:hypothetical protein
MVESANVYKASFASTMSAMRSFLIGPDGLVIASYDKIHMFDIDRSARDCGATARRDRRSAQGATRGGRRPLRAWSRSAESPAALRPKQHCAGFPRAASHQPSITFFIRLVITNR